jgi:hypothetical protein
MIQIKFFKRSILKSNFTVILILSLTTAFAQKEAKIFTEYRKDKSVLPDFSYAGYQNGDVEVPNIKNYKVFDVTSFGAIANDTLSDKIAIQKAISAANINGSGVVFFPTGRFLVNENGDEPNKILSKGSNIIFRGSGSGSGGTELFMKNMLPPTDPAKMWTVPPMFVFTSGGADKKIGTVIESANIGSFDLKINTTEGLKAGDWIILKLLDNNEALIKEEMGYNDVDPTWTYLVNKGIDVQVFYQIKKIINETITLSAPISYKIDSKYNWEVIKFTNSQEVGIENIAFVGNWKEKFIHHRSWQDDSGYSMINFLRLTNSWIKNCRFTDCNVAAIILKSANVSVINCKITGNGGHEAITSNASTNVLIAKCVDEASQFHSFGSSHTSMNTVVWKCIYPSTSCFESHSNQPRNTLLDNIQGGLLTNRAGGAVENMPNHMQGLVLWNYNQTNEATKNFEFWSKTEAYWKIPNPIIVGYKSIGTTFNLEQLGYSESLDGITQPASLYEAQLKLRLKSLPEWLKELE